MGVNPDGREQGARLRSQDPHAGEPGSAPELPHHGSRVAGRFLGQTRWNRKISDGMERGIGEGGETPGGGYRCRCRPWRRRGEAWLGHSAALTRTLHSNF
jgi:hypothetical protein